MSYSMVVTVPACRAMFMRDYQNKMYSVSAFYLALCSAVLCSYMIYPVVVTLVTFHRYDFKHESFGDMITWMEIMMLQAMAGSIWGLMLGTFIDTFMIAGQINQLACVLFSFGGGMFANLGNGVNPLVDLLSQFSPYRCTMELLLRREVHGQFGGHLILKKLGYTWGEERCVRTILLFTLISFLVGWASLLYRSRR